MTPTKNLTHKPLKGIRVLSLALNLPGPAALMRLKSMGANCYKLEPRPAHADNNKSALKTADPMGIYMPKAYEEMHEGIRVSHADLKTTQGQTALHKLLAKTDVLITSFRPSALEKLGISWNVIQKKYPTLCMVSIVGSSGARAEEPRHDLTYLGENGLVNALEMPATLFADMTGSLMTTEVVMQALLLRNSEGRYKNKGVFYEVSLSQAAEYLALPRKWGLTLPTGDVGGNHAGYRVYPCKNGRVAVAALEPHFALRLCEVAGLPKSSALQMHHKNTHRAIESFLMKQSRKDLDRLARVFDIPLHTLS